MSADLVGKPLGQFDVVALKAVLHRTDISEDIKPGKNGTIIDILPDGVFEVEFADSFGNTEYMAYLRAEELELIWSYREHQRTKAVPEKLPSSKYDLYYKLG